jgi:hypothetical protein
MNPFEILVVIIGIIVIVNFLKARRRGGGLPFDAPAEDGANDALKSEVQSLKERIAVLERIATDGGNRLEQEIEKLRDR